MRASLEHAVVHFRSQGAWVLLGNTTTWSGVRALVGPLAEVWGAKVRLTLTWSNGESLVVRVTPGRECLSLAVGLHVHNAGRLSRVAPDGMTGAWYAPPMKYADHATYGRVLRECSLPAWERSVTVLRAHDPEAYGRVFS